MALGSWVGWCLLFCPWLTLPFRNTEPRARQTCPLGPQRKSEVKAWGVRESCKLDTEQNTLGTHSLPCTPPGRAVQVCRLQWVQLEQSCQPVLYGQGLLEGDLGPPPSRAKDKEDTGFNIFYVLNHVKPSLRKDSTSQYCGYASRKVQHTSRHSESCHCRVTMSDPEKQKRRAGRSWRQNCMHVPSDHKRSVRTTPERKSAAKSCLLNAGLVLVCSCNSPPAPLKTTIVCPSPEHVTSVRAHTPKHNFLAKSHCYLGGTHTRTGPVHVGPGAPAG